MAADLPNSNTIMSCRWEDVKASGNIPDNRTYASMVSYGDSLWLFGGLGQKKQRLNDLHRYDSSMYVVHCLLFVIYDVIALCCCFSCVCVLLLVSMCNRACLVFVE